jgi:SAM-dependent methyltransferase
MLPTVRLDAGDEKGLGDLRQGLAQLLSAAPANPLINRLLTGHQVRAGDLPPTSAPGELLARMERHGLLASDGPRVGLPFQIRLVDGSVIVTDRYTRRQRAEPSFVDPLWGGPTLNKLLVRGPARRALDIGCGSGVMTIAAAAFCERVVGVDVNPRALAFSRFNLALNRVDNAEILHSDLFEAVRGQRFDRIIFNSPTGCELRPRNWLEAGETILERFFSDVLHHLEEDGYTHVSLCFMDRRRSRFWTRFDEWLDAQKRLQVVWVERSSVDAGLPLFIWRVLRSLRDRTNAFDVKAVRRGWLVLKRGAPLSLRIRLDYKRESSRLSANFGDHVFRLLLGTGRLPRPDDLRDVWTAPPDVIGDCLRHIQPIAWS